MMRSTFRPVLVAGPQAKPVTLLEAKQHLRVDHEDDDTLIESLIGAVVDHLDGWSGILGRCLMSQSWQQDFDGIAHLLRLPMLALSLTSVTYIAADGETVTIPEGDAMLYHDALGSFVDVLRNKGLPALADVVAPVRVTAVYGYGAADKVPPAIKAAMLLMIGDLYANRETAAAGNVTEIPMSTTVNALLAPHRRVSL